MKQLLPLCLLLALALLAPLGVRHVSARGAIDPALAAELAAGAPSDQRAVIVILADQINPRAIGGRSRQERRANLVRALKAKAELRQAKLRRDLAKWQRQGHVTAFTPLWGINAIAVTADSATIQSLSSSPGVAQVLADGTTGAPPAPASGSLPTPSLDAIHAPALWAMGYYGQGVVVANLDTGVDGAHPDLAPRYRGGSNSWLDPYGQHAAPFDANGHGTQTMGVMVGGDSVGYVIGAAPQATWIAAKIFNDSGTATASAIHQALQWVLDPDGDPATDDGADVVNNSWAFGGAGCDLTFAQDLQNLLAAGVVPVFAAGNYGPAASTGTSPANNPGALAVGAADDAGAILGLSSRGPDSCGGRAGVYPDLVAPGSNVITTDIAGGYYTPSGTSLSAPAVAGGLALLLSAYPNLGVAEQRAALVGSTTDLGAAGPDDVFGAGMLNLQAAYAALSGVGGATSTPTSTAIPPTATAMPASTATSTATNTPLPPTATRTATNTPLPPTATRTATNTPLPPTATRTATPAAPGAMLADDFESGTTSSWAAVVGGSQVSVSGAAALSGARGLQVQVNSTAGRYLVDLGPAAEPRYRARFRWSPNGVSMASGRAHDLISGYDSGGARVFRVQMRYYAGGYQLRAGLIVSGGGEQLTSWYSVSGAAHTVELAWQAGSTPTSKDGSVGLWVDGALKQTKGGVANGAYRLEEVRLGLTGVGTSISGTEYFDAFVSTRGELIP